MNQFITAHPRLRRKELIKPKNNRLLFRRMRPEDLKEVLAIEKLCFSNPWSQDVFLGEIQNKTISFPLVAIHLEDRKIIGYIIFWLIGDEAQINNVAIHPDYQGKGYGELALRYVIERLRENKAQLAILEVRTSNRPAISLYRKLGFNILGIRKDYYTNPVEDAYLMGLNLN